MKSANRDFQTVSELKQYFSKVFHDIQTFSEMTRDFHRCSEQFSDIFSNVNRYSWVFSYVQAFSEITIDFHRFSAVLRHFQCCSEIFIGVKRCSVLFSNDQRFSVLIIAVSALKIAEFLLCNNTDHRCFSSETVIFVEIHVMCINYQFLIILKNLFTSLNHSRVSMIIPESSKDVNPGFAVNMSFGWLADASTSEWYWIH